MKDNSSYCVIISNAIVIWQIERVYEDNLYGWQILRTSISTALTELWQTKSKYFNNGYFHLLMPKFR